MLTTHEVGERIAVARKLHNLSQAQLSEQLSISAQAVGKWERGESMPDIIMFQRIAAVLGTDMNYFAGESTAEVDSDGVKSTIELAQKQTGKSLDWNMSAANWVDMDFSGLHGLTERLSGANIEKCQFVDSDLAGLALKANNIKQSDFTSSDISGCSVKSTNIDRCNFAKCNLANSEFSRSTVRHSDFSAADLTGLSAKWCHLNDVKLTGAVLNQTKFAMGQLTELTFSGDIIECSFENCDFTRVVFQDAVLRQCFFKNAKLRRTKFLNCQADRLTYAFMKACKADLSDVTIIEDDTEV